jgi:ATP-dependent helicase HrpA
MLPAYLRLNCRVLGENGNVVAQTRDATHLIEQHAHRAREAIRQTAPSASWERTGVVSWDFGDLPAFVSKRVLGTELRLYPALVDRQKSVDLTLLESADEAERSTRKGVLRLLQLASPKPLAGLAKRVPPPFTRRLGLPPSRAEVEVFRELALSRVVQEAFGLDAAVAPPRTRAAFDALLKAGAPRIEGAFTELTRVLAAVSVELDKTLRALDSASKQPSGTAAVRELRAQLEQLFPQDLLANVELCRLEQFPRYLRAMQTRLTRAINDPRKDADKNALFAPAWQGLLAKQATVRDQKTLRELRWAFEELRVAIFAPELKAAAPVSASNLAAAVSSLR